MKIITALFLTLIVSNASAYFKDGNLLLLKMQEFEKVVEVDPTANYRDAVEYKSYVVGVFVSLSLKKSICVNNVKSGKVAEVVIKYIKKNPAKRGEPAFDLVKNALEVAFPCK